MGAMTATVDTDTARGLLMLNPLLMPRPSPRLMPPQLPTTAMAALAAMEVMEAMAATDTARGLLMPMLTTVMVVMAAMEAMAATDMARGLLMPMPTMAMAAMEVMEVMEATDTARGLLMPMLTTAMVVMAVATDTAMASKSLKSVTICELSFPLIILTQTVQHPIMTIVICDTN